MVAVIKKILLRRIDRFFCVPTVPLRPEKHNLLFLRHFTQWNPGRNLVLGTQTGTQTPEAGRKPQGCVPRVTHVIACDGTIGTHGTQKNVSILKRLENFLLPLVRLTGMLLICSWRLGFLGRLRRAIRQPNQALPLPPRLSVEGHGYA